MIFWIFTANHSELQYCGSKYVMKGYVKNKCYMNLNCHAMIIIHLQILYIYTDEYLMYNFKPQKKKNVILSFTPLHSSALRLLLHQPPTHNDKNKQ